MLSKRHFKKRTLLKKHKKVNLTKKYNKKRLTKSIIKKLVGGAPKQISHMWFKKWPDHGVPVEMDNFHEFIRSVFNDMSEYGGNTVIHCSAGVGRTGVVYVVLKLLSEADAYNNPRTGDIKERIDAIINEERKNRNQHFVQADIQYNFIYKYFTGNNMSDFTKRFDGLSHTGCETDLPDKSIMGNRNRYSDIIPCESKRVMLKGDNTYINASNMTPLTVNGREIKIIAAQCPKDDDTIRDFYQMVNENDIKRIIMVTGLSEKGELKCKDYFGSGLNNFQPIPNSVDMVVSSKVEHKDIFEGRILTNQQPIANSQGIEETYYNPFENKKYKQADPQKSGKTSKVTAKSHTPFNPFTEQEHKPYVNNTSAPPTGRKPKVQPQLNVSESQREQVKIDPIKTNIKQLNKSKNKSIPNSQGRVDICSLLKRTETEKKKKLIDEIEELKKKGNPFL